jgi:cytochrome b561
MEDFWDRIEDGYATGFPTEPAVLTHAVSGAAIFVLMAIRIAARLRFGAPPLPAGLHPLLKALAHSNHFALYALLLLLPLSGATAILSGVELAAELHGSLVWLLFLLVALHIAGVIHHTFVRRDGLIWRMLLPR